MEILVIGMMQKRKMQQTCKKCPNYNICNDIIKQATERYANAIKNELQGAIPAMIAIERLQLVITDCKNERRAGDTDD